jgi:hypothetical protein
MAPIPINSERVESPVLLAHYPVMPQSLAKIIVHAVYSAKDRRPFLCGKSLRETWRRCLGGIPAHHDCQPLACLGLIQLLQS